MFTDEEKNKWRSANGARLPDGDYSGTLKKVNIKEIKDSKRLILEFEILKGSHAGRIYSAFWGLDNFGTVVNLKKMGVNTEIELDYLDEEISKHLNQLFDFSLYTKGKYQNCTMAEETKIENILPTDNSKEDDIPF